MNSNDQKKLTYIYASLLEEYKYHNFKKLILIFQNWLSRIELIHKENNVMDYDKATLSTPDKILINNKRLGSNPRKPSNFLNTIFKKILSNALTIIFPKTVYGPGGFMDNNFLSKLTSDLVFKFLSKKTQINNQFYSSFIERSQKDLSDGNILKIIPSKFFTKEYPQIIGGGEVNLVCSPTILLNSNWFNVLFIPKPVRIIGIAHGGNYDEFVVNKFQSFEEDISESYYGWGLNRYKNISQNRFKKENEEMVHYKKRFGWIERLPPTVLEVQQIPSTKIIYADSQKIFKYLTNRDSKIIVYNHPRSTISKLRLRSMKSDKETTYIIGNPGHTVLYEFLYTKIPFIIIFKESWLNYLTPKMKEWVSFLKNSGVLFFFEEKAILEKTLKLIENNQFSPVNYEELIKFLENDSDTLSF
jgi:hypothetical protein